MVKKAKKNRFLKYGIGAVILLILFVVIGRKMGWVGGAPRIQVAVEETEKRTIAETVSASGKIQPEVEVKISADVSGEIVELHVKEGDKVKRGQLLLKIKPDIYVSNLDRSNASLNTTRANLANAEARLVQVESQFKKAQASYTRSKKLYHDKIISESEFEAAESAYEVAKAEVDAARQSVVGARFNVRSAQASVKESRDNLSKTTIFAPVDGTVSRLNVEVGERVVGTLQMAGTEIMRIANLNTMEVNVDVNENDINRVSLGDTATIEVDAFLDSKFKGIVTEIANSANVLGATVDQVTNFAVKIRILPESYSQLVKEGSVLSSPFRPGLSATVEVQTEKISNIITVPIQAVTTRIDSTDQKKAAMQKDKTSPEKAKKKTAEVPKEYVFVIDGGKVRQVEVKTGIQDDMYIQILSGLKEKDKVVVAPYLAISKKLKDGTAVDKVDRDKLFTQENK